MIPGIRLPDRQASRPSKTLAKKICGRMGSGPTVAKVDQREKDGGRDDSNGRAISFLQRGLHITAETGLFADSGYYGAHNDKRPGRPFWKRLELFVIGGKPFGRDRDQTERAHKRSLDDQHKQQRSDPACGAPQDTPRSRRGPYFPVKHFQ